MSPLFALPPAVRRTVCLASASLLFAALLPNAAIAYPASVIAKCRGDYKRLCPQYKKPGDALDACMRANYRSISNACMNTLVDAGIAPPLARRR